LLLDGDVKVLFSVEATLQQMGEEITPLQRLFFEAMVFDLEYCRDLD
jgi:hypothetical protein